MWWECLFRTPTFRIDHAKSIPDAIGSGMKVYSTYDVAEKYKGVVPLKEMSGYKIGGYKVFVIPAKHDVPCYAYVVEHKDMGKLLFVTDTMMLEYKVAGLNHIMIEANYSDEIVDKNIDKGYIPSSMRDRLMTTHFSIDNAIGMLKANDLSHVNNIVLLHLSSIDSNEDEFHKKVTQATGKTVYVAKKGLEIYVGKDVY